MTDGASVKALLLSIVRRMGEGLWGLGALHPALDKLRTLWSVPHPVGHGYVPGSSIACRGTKLQIIGSANRFQ
jgi:hypothetical protein